MGRVSFPGLKSPGHGVDNTPTSRAKVKERVELYIYSLRAIVACSVRLEGEGDLKPV
jgi:hypothetical protein